MEANEKIDLELRAMSELLPSTQKGIDTNKQYNAQSTNTK